MTRPLPGLTTRSKSEGSEAIGCPLSQFHNPHRLPVMGGVSPVSNMTELASNDFYSKPSALGRWQRPSRESLRLGVRQVWL